MFLLIFSLAYAADEQHRDVKGPCVDTHITEIGTRLVDGDGTPDPDSGVSIFFTSGLALVDYSTPAEVKLQHPGDAVRVCLVAVPVDCPPGDDRGKLYRVQDAHLRISYVLPDAMHMCGGA